MDNPSMSKQGCFRPVCRFGKRLLAGSILVCLLISACASAAVANDEIRDRAENLLLQAADAPDALSRASAERALAELGYLEMIESRDFSRVHSARFDVYSVYRIWIAAILAQGKDEEEFLDHSKQLYRLAIVEAQDVRRHAIHALFRLHAPIPDEPLVDLAEHTYVTELERLASEDRLAEAPFYTGLLLLQASDEARPRYVERLVEFFQSPDAEIRAHAYQTVLRLPYVDSSLWSALQAGDKGGDSQRARTRLLARYEYEVDGKSDRLQQEFERISRESIASTSDVSDFLGVVDLLDWFADAGARSELISLDTVLQSAESDPRIRNAAAYAALRISRRREHSLGILDWLVIAGYAIGMVAIGIYYARRTENAEEYLLGGRRMSPTLVGFSMFATLLSTLTFLAQPGEVIQNGPMTLFQLVSYPFVFVVVGWLLIPHIMRLKVTSGYEMLESRLGVSSRLLGSCIFLVLRLLWMATIVYVTTSTVLVPILGWDENATGWVCLVIGVVTIFYTSLGGLRAVVVTDVIQTAVLFIGAVVVLLMITSELGGVNEWWPNSWYQHWQEPIVFDIAERTSFVGLFFAMFAWQVCTHGSDQMAMQRYLATRDLKAARGVLGISLLTSAVVVGFLGCVGLAILAYLRKVPHAIPDGQSLYADADKMLPAIVVTKLPVGMSGLVIAGLLAAAMSSLSSGLNSSSSVITSDLVSRFRKSPLAEESQIRMARWISVLVGGIVVAMSLYVSIVPGNVFELCFKIVNLLVGPLFLLFFQAFFMRRANQLSAWAGVITGSATAIVIGFWEPLFQSAPPISFVWLTPLSFIVGLGCATIVIGTTNRGSGNLQAEAETVD